MSLPSALNPPSAKEFQPGIVRIMFVYTTIALSLIFLGIFVFGRYQAHLSIYSLANYVGPIIKNPVTGRGFVSYGSDFTSNDMVAFHAHRMPLVPCFLAGLTLIVGDHLKVFDLIKSVLFVVSLLVALRLAIGVRLPPRLSWLVAFLIVPFLILTFLIDVVNFQVEEGYTYSLIALALAILLFAPDSSSNRWKAAFAASLLGIYLSKSSMLPLCLWLLVSFAWRNKFPRAWGSVCVVFLLGMLLWGGYVHTVTGRFTLGTTIDGENLFGQHLLTRQGERTRAQQGALDGTDRAADGGLAEAVGLPDVRLGAVLSPVHQGYQEPVLRTVLGTAATSG